MPIYNTIICIDDEDVPISVEYTAYAFAEDRQMGYDLVELDGAWTEGEDVDVHLSERQTIVIVDEIEELLKDRRR